MGSVSMQCHSNGTCHCRQGFVGYKCDKCELNYFHNRATHQCEECPVCYGLVKNQVSVSVTTSNLLPIASTSHLQLLACWPYDLTSIRTQWLILTLTTEPFRTFCIMNVLLTNICKLAEGEQHIQSCTNNGTHLIKLLKNTIMCFWLNRL